MANINGTINSDTLNGTMDGDNFFGSAGNDTFFGNGGSDFAVYAPLTQGVTVTFSDETLYSGTANKASGNDTFTGIRGAVGSNFNDTLIGTILTGATAPFSVILRGNAGNDLIDGRNNQLNVAMYSSATTGVVIDLEVNTVNGDRIGTAQDGQGGTDTLRNVLRVQGSGFDDSITGSSREDRFEGSLGNDTYNGGGLSDLLDYAFFPNTHSIVATAGAPAPGLYGFGSFSVQKVAVAAGGTNFLDTATSVNQVRGTNLADTLIGTTAAYSFYAYSLRGGGGNDTIDGKGLAHNRADYASAPSAVTVDLAFGTAFDGQGGTDTLIDVVAVRGSNFNDTLLGDTRDNVFVWSDLGQHTVDGRGGMDRVAFAGTGDVTIDLGASLTNGNYVGSITKAAGPDTLTNIANAQGGLGNDWILGTPDNNRLSGGPGSNTLDGRGGYDLVNYLYYNGISDQPQGVIVNLNDGLTGTATNSWGGTDTLFNIEGAVGTHLADDITGAVLANGDLSYILGEGGNDILRAPVATTRIVADYNDSLSAVQVNLQAGVTSDDGWFGGQDTLVNIQSARGSAFSDTLVGSDLANRLDGSGGADLLFGLGGDDVLIGGAAPSGQFNQLWGGAGSDTASYFSATTAVYADLRAGAGSVGGVLQDTYNSIENLVGGTANDLLVGNDEANLLNGFGGTDQLFAFGGNDRFIGGTAAAGTQNQLWGGDGSDTVDYSAQTASVYVELRAPAGYVNGQLTDLMNSVENAIGGSGNDTLVGTDTDANTLSGGGGTDVIFGFGGNDTLLGGSAGAGQYNQLWGGDGSDAASYEGTSAAVYADLNVLAGWVSNGSSLVVTDVYNSIESLVGGSGADTLAGDASANRITGGAGADILYGRGGADTFVYRAASESSLTAGYDTVADFQTGSDKVDLTALGVSQGQALIVSGGGSTSLYVDVDQGTAGYELAISFIGANAVQTSDLLL